MVRLWSFVSIGGFFLLRRVRFVPASEDKARGEATLVLGAWCTACAVVLLLPTNDDSNETITNIIDTRAFLAEEERPTVCVRIDSGSSYLITINNSNNNNDFLLD